MKASTICILGAPMDFGAGRRGVDMGPSALRKAGLNRKLRELGYQVVDLGNVLVEQQENTPEGLPNAKFLDSIVQSCAGLAETVDSIIEAEQFPLVLGGAHSIAAGKWPPPIAEEAKKSDCYGLMLIPT